MTADSQRAVRFLRWLDNLLGSDQFPIRVDECDGRGGAMIPSCGDDPWVPCRGCVNCKNGQHDGR